MLGTWGLLYYTLSFCIGLKFSILKHFFNVYLWKKKYEYKSVILASPMPIKGAATIGSWRPDGKTRHKPRKHSVSESQMELGLEETIHSKLEPSKQEIQVINHINHRGWWSNFHKNIWILGQPKVWQISALLCFSNNDEAVWVAF